jgi:IS30 family transposase
MEHDTLKAKKVYHQLTLGQREEIAIGLENGKSLSQIARELGVDKSTVSRELKRNNAQMNEVKYRGHRAQSATQLPRGLMLVKKKAIGGKDWQIH